jgi:hypothetical protein
VGHNAAWLNAPSIFRQQQQTGGSNNNIGCIYFSYLLRRVGRPKTFLDESEEENILHISKRIHTSHCNFPSTPSLNIADS